MTNTSKPKIGEGALAAYARQGLAEVRAALYTQSPIAQPTDHGMWGRLTQGEIADQREGDAKGRESADERETGSRDNVLGKYTGRSSEGRVAEREAQQERTDERSLERE